MECCPNVSLFSYFLVQIFGENHLTKTTSNFGVGTFLISAVSGFVPSKKNRKNASREKAFRERSLQILKL